MDGNGFTDYFDSCDYFDLLLSPSWDGIDNVNFRFHGWDD